MKVPLFTQRLFLFSGFLAAFLLVSSLAFSQQYKKNSGTGSVVFTSEPTIKHQQLYTAADLGNPITGVIDKVYFRKGGTTASTTLTNFKIRIGTVDATSFPSPANQFVTNLTTVFNKASYTISAPTGNVFFAFDVDNILQYEEGKSLIIEYSFSTSSAPAFAVLFSNGPTGSSTKHLFASSLSATSGSATQVWFDFGLDLASSVSAPDNDECASATLINPTSNFTKYTTNSIGATQSLTPVTCGTATSSLANDVWFRFYSYGPADSISVRGLGGFDPVIQLFSGSCGSPVNVACSDDPQFSDAVEIIAPGNLGTFTQYWLRVYGWNGTSGTFEIGVKSADITPPSTDNCNTLTFLQSTTNYNYASGDNRGANQTYSPSACGGGFSSGQAYDIWYTFDCFRANDSIILLPDLDFKPAVEMYFQACTPGGSLACAQNQFVPGGKVVLAPGNLTPGQQYYLRVYGWDGMQGTFKICVKRTPASSLANDECINAIPLTPATTCNSVTGTTTGANQSMLAGCQVATNLPENDVWYKFVAQSFNDTVFVTPTSSFNPIVELFSGCGQNFHLKCSNSQGVNSVEKVGGGLQTGQTYYVRIHGWTTTNGSFNICVKTPGSVNAPANDACSAPIGLTVNTVCNPTAGTNTAATQSFAPVLCGNPTASTTAADVWYSFVASASGDSVIVDPLVSFDAVLQLFSSNCNASSSIACSDNPNTGGATEKVSPGNLIPGQTYYIRVYGWNTSQGDFNICVKSGSCISQAGTATSNVSSLVSNGSMLANLVGYSGTGTWYYTFDPGSGVWNSLSTFSPPDTFFVSGSVNDTVYLKAQVTTGSCIPEMSNPISVAMRCATPITQKNGAISGVYVAGVQVGTISNTSTFDVLRGAYQDFSTVSGAFCKGKTYPFVITPSSSASLYKSVWVDFNNDGDFSDAGESVYGPTATAGSASSSFTIPASTGASSVKMRVMVFAAGTAGVSTDPCFNGPYASGEIEEYTLNLFNAPSVANAGSNQTVCSGTATLNATVPASGSGSWSLVSGSGTIANASLANSGVSNLGLGANVFRWSVATACSTSQAQVTITNTQAPASNAGTDQTVCGTTASLSGNNPVGSTTGQWTTLVGSGSFANSTSASTTVSGLASGINRFIWTLTTTGCGQTKDTVQITRFADPTTPVAGNDQTVCSNTAQLSGNIITSGTGFWTLISGSGAILNPSNNTTVVAGLNPGPNVFRWSSQVASCPALTDEVTITVSPTVQANAGSSQILCADQTTLSGNNPGTGSGLWTLLSGSGIILNPSSPTTGFSNIGAGENKLVWTILNGNCPTTSDTTVVNRVPNQSANAGQDQSVCGGQATLSATQPSAGSGLWSVVSGSALISNPSNPNTVITNMGTGIVVLRWTITNLPCPNVSDEVSINNLGNVTIAQAGADQTLCSSQATLSGNTATIGVGNWTLISGSGTIASPGNPNSTVSSLGVGLNVFRWTITNGSCPPSFDDVTLSRTAAPSVANAGSDQTICTNTATLSANIPGSGSGTWSLVSGSGQINDPQNPATAVSGLSNGANVFRWTVANAPCPESSDEVTINTSGNSVASNAGQDQVVCSESATLSANNAGTGTGTWTVVTGAGTFASPNAHNSAVSGMAGGLNRYRWTIVNGACPPSTDEVEVIRTDQTSVANAGLDQTLCTSTATLSAAVPQNGTGSWSLVSGTGTISEPTQANTTVTGLGNGVNTFRWTVSNVPCSSTSDEVSITTTLSATTANAGTDQTFCGGTAQLSGNNPGSGTGVWTVISGSGNITNPNGATTSVTGLSSGANVFRWTVTTGTCTPSTDEVTLTSVNNPVAANAGNDQTICGSAATLAANTPTVGTGSWSLVSGSGQIANPNDPSTTIVGLGNGANVFRWTISNQPCPLSFDDITINATPGNVTAQAGLDKTVCGSTTFLNATAPIIGFGAWTLVTGSGTVSQPGNPVSEVTNLGSGVNTFAWTVVSGSCTASDIVAITKEINTLSLGPDTLVCIGSNYTLQAGAGFVGYLWFDGSTQSSLSVDSTGNYGVQVTTSNLCTFRDTAKVTFVICTDIAAQISRDENLILYPNPTDGQLFWQWKSTQFNGGKTRLINSLGATVWEEDVAEQADNLHEVRLPKIAAGLYLFEWETKERKIGKKVVVR